MTKPARTPAPESLRDLTPSERFIFDLLVDRAVRDLRAPTRDEISGALTKRGLPQEGGPAITTKLGVAGYIRGEVAAHNWRTIWILTGPHAGKHTRPPGNAKPYLVSRKLTDQERRRLLRLAYIRYWARAQPPPLPEAADA